MKKFLKKIYKMDSVLVQCISILVDAHSLMPVEISTELIWMKLKESVCLFLFFYLVRVRKDGAPAA